MSDSLSEFEKEVNKKSLPTGINVLTILTFIGSGLGLFSGIWSYLKSAENLETMEAMTRKPEFAKMPDFAKKMYSPEAIELLRKISENKLPVLIINLVSCALCIYGAIEMRKLKMNGLYAYGMGSFLPFIGMFLLIGGSFFNGFSIYLSLGITVLFVVLYAAQAKYLTNK